VGALAVEGKVPAGSPPTIFAQAIAGFLTGIGLPEQLIFTLITLAVSAFALTSLDSVARVGRLAFQELFTDAQDSQNPIVKLLANSFVATFLTLFMGYLLALRGYQNIWPLFGSANQLLAALALIACAVFLKRTKREGWMMYFPMIAMLCVTFTALGLTIYKLVDKLGTGNFAMASDGLQLVFAVLLLGLGVMVAASGIKKLREKAA
jgi:carbon starvation protein